jgi:adenosylcobyric acid synthase
VIFKPKARVLAVWGCSSHAGKTALVAGLCRAFTRAGLRVAPFKAQNMALNAMVSKEGGEMAAAQVYQALACGLEPSVHMNPVLLKPEGDKKSELIVQGRSWGSFDTMGYYALKRRLLGQVANSFYRLCEGNDLIIVEGAGSCAEVNLRRHDLANRFLSYLKADQIPTLIVADIERGGVFAQIVGTHRLLTPKERKGVKGVIINKFRGEERLLEGGIERIEQMCRWRVLAVLPYLEGLRMMQEDSLSIEDGLDSKRTAAKNGGALRVGVVRFRRIANVTDFAPLKDGGQFSVRLVETPNDLEGLELLILPGTKHVGSELRFLRQSGLTKAILEFHRGGGWLFGLCGGFEILCAAIEDPNLLELEASLEEGLGVLPLRARFGKTRLKAVKDVKVVGVRPGFKPSPPITGYEIHRGWIEGVDQKKTWFELESGVPEGLLDIEGRVMGTFLHGLFDTPSFRDYLLSLIKAPCVPLDVFERPGVIDFRTMLLAEIERFSDVLSERLELESLLGTVS